MSLNNKVVAVTGGFGSLGKAVIAAARAAGARTVAIDRTSAAGLASENADLLLGDVDLGSATATQACFATIQQTLGGLDALVNVAGGFHWEKFESTGLDSWDSMYGINLRTAVSASQAALPLLLQRGGGRIVNIAAGGALKASAGIGAYAAAKAGVARFTEALADELQDRNITVNALLPSIIDTPPNRRDMPDADFSRWVRPAQLAEVIVFLLSALQASAITGALIPVNGRV